MLNKHPCLTDFCFNHSAYTFYQGIGCGLMVHKMLLSNLFRAFAFSFWSCESPDYDQHGKSEKKVGPSATARRWRDFATASHTRFSAKRPLRVGDMHTYAMTDCVKGFWFSCPVYLTQVTHFIPASVVHATYRWSFMSRSKEWKRTLYNMDKKEIIFGLDETRLKDLFKEVFKC